MPAVTHEIVRDVSLSNPFDNLRETPVDERLATGKTDVYTIPKGTRFIDDAKQELRFQLFYTYDIVANAMWTSEIAMARESEAQDHNLRLGNNGAAAAASATTTGNPRASLEGKVSQTGKFSYGGRCPGTTGHI